MTTSSANSSPLSAKAASTVRYEILDDGKALVLRDAIYDPNEKCYFNIHIDRPQAGGVWSWVPFTAKEREGNPFSAITEEKIRKIQETYIEALKRIESRPSDNPVILTNRRCTKYKDKNHAERTDSEIDSASFGTPEKKIHKLMVEGILNPLGAGSVETSSQASTTELPELPVEGGGACRAIPPPEALDDSTDLIPVLNSTATNWTAAHTGGVRKKGLPKVPTESEYAGSSEKKRIAMLADHLNKVDPSIPFSAFITNNTRKETNGDFFNRMKKSLERIAQNPAGRGDRIGRSEDDIKDDNQMYGVLIRWNDAAYEYLKKNGGRLPGMAPKAPPVSESHRLSAWTTENDRIDSELWRKECPSQWIPHLYASTTDRESFKQLIEHVEKLKTS